MRHLALLLIALLLTGCAAAARPAQGPRPYSSDEHRFSAAIPAGWHVAAESLTPRLSDPVEVLSAGTIEDLRPVEDDCAHVAVGALERLGSQDAFVTVQERFGTGDFPPRPDAFSLTGRVRHGQARTCAAGEAQLVEYWFEFRDAGRSFHALVAFGPEAPPETRQQALALLDSLRFEPGPEGVDLDPDRAVHFEDRDTGLSWTMPVPPWRRYSWPFTSVQGQRLALGTFPLERGAPEANCTPRAALDAMGEGDAFIYLFEYVDLAERWKRGIPDRPPRLTLGPEVAFECMGESRMVTWKERGRAFQAHVYLGDRASERLRDDALSILNSIQVR